MKYNESFNWFNIWIINNEKYRFFCHFVDNLHIISICRFFWHEKNENIDQIDKMTNSFFLTRNQYIRVKFLIFSQINYTTIRTIIHFFYLIIWLTFWWNVKTFVCFLKNKLLKFWYFEKISIASLLRLFVAFVTIFKCTCDNSNWTNIA